MKSKESSGNFLLESTFEVDEMFFGGRENGVKGRKKARKNF